MGQLPGAPARPVPNGREIRCQRLQLVDDLEQAIPRPSRPRREALKAERRPRATEQVADVHVGASMYTGTACGGQGKAEQHRENRQLPAYLVVRRFITS